MLAADPAAVVDMPAVHAEQLERAAVAVEGGGQAVAGDRRGERDSEERRAAVRECRAPEHSAAFTRGCARVTRCRHGGSFRTLSAA